MLAAVMVLDQRGSRHSDDYVESYMAALNEKHYGLLRLPFVRTAGDEMQGVLVDPEAIVEIAHDAIVDGGWWIGIGFGVAEIPPDAQATARDSRGEAFWCARDAVDAAKRQRPRRPIAARGATDAVDDFNRCIGALAFVIKRRTTRQQQVASRYRANVTQAVIAREQGKTQQTVSQLIEAAGVVEELELERLAVSLARQALGA